MARSFIIALFAAAVSITDGCTPRPTGRPNVAPEATAPASVDGELGAGEGPYVSTEMTCQEMHELARSRVHDCEWAGTLVHLQRVLAETCDTRSLTGRLREADVIYETCAWPRHEPPREPLLPSERLWGI